MNTIYIGDLDKLPSHKADTVFIKQSNGVIMGIASNKITGTDNKIIVSIDEQIKQIKASLVFRTISGQQVEQIQQVCRKCSSKRLGNYKATSWMNFISLYGANCLHIWGHDNAVTNA
jgi:hypothetical protein